MERFSIASDITAIGGPRKLRAAILSIGVNLFLIAVKSAVGITSGSVAVLAEVGHSISDLTASLFAYWGIKSSLEPPDAEHHYGHEKFENLSSLIQTIILVGICLYIFYEVGRRLLFGFSLQVTNASLAVMAGAIVIDFFTARYLTGVASIYGSSALQADAYHFLTDMWSAVAVLVGLAAARFGYAAMDPIAAAAVAVAMLYAAVRLAQKTAAVLVDASPGPEIESQVRAVVESTPGVEGFHSLRMRQAGNKIWLDVSIHLDPGMSLKRAHEIADTLAERVRQAVPSVREAVIHTEPADEHVEDYDDRGLESNRRLDTKED